MKFINNLFLIACLVSIFLQSVYSVKLENEYFNKRIRTWGNKKNFVQTGMNNEAMAENEYFNKRIRTWGNKKNFVQTGMLNEATKTELENEEQYKYNSNKKWIR